MKYFIIHKQTNEQTENKVNKKFNVTINKN